MEVRSVSKCCGEGKSRHQALKGIGLCFRKNEFVAILGPSGSGKTTLLNIIGGLDHYDSGGLVIDHISTKNCKNRDWNSYRNHSAGFIFQNYHLIPHQTVLSNVEMALTISGISGAERKARSSAALKAVGLGEHLSKRPSQVSGGEMQRAAIARALVHNPKSYLPMRPLVPWTAKTRDVLLWVSLPPLPPAFIICGTSESALFSQLLQNPLESSVLR